MRHTTSVACTQARRVRFAGWARGPDNAGPGRGPPAFLLVPESRERLVQLPIARPTSLAPRLNFIFKRHNLRRAGAAAVHNRQRVFAGNAGVSFYVSLREAGILDQPGRGNFSLLGERRIARDLQISPACVSAVACSALDKTGFLKNDPALRLSGSPAVINMPFLARTVRTALRTSPSVGDSAFGKILLQVGITQSWLAFWNQRIADMQNDVSPALARIENTSAIFKPALAGLQFANPVLRQIKRRNRSDRLRDFLPVRADVLYRSSTHAARNPAQAFHAGKISVYTIGNKMVPIDSCAHVESNLAVMSCRPSSSIPTCKTRPFQPRSDTTRFFRRPARTVEFVGSCEPDRLLHHSSAGGPDEIARVASDTQRCERGEWNVFLNFNSGGCIDSLSIYTAIRRGPHGKPAASH